MKATFLTMLALLLSACNSIPFMADDSQDKNDAVAAAEVQPEPAGRAEVSYLQIAKDLFVAKQYKQAFQIAEKLSEEKDNVEAQYLLGYMLYYGYGVTADVEQGKKWISVAADTGYRPAIEALVLIKHGLTPDNKCSSVNLLPAQADKHPVDNKNETTLALKEGEVLITPKGSHKIKSGESGLNKPDETTKGYTIQLISSRSRTYAEKYARAFKTKYPDLQAHIIIYQSKSADRNYGVGYSTFEHEKDAHIVLQNIKERMDNSSLWIRSLKKFELLN